MRAGWKAWPGTLPPWKLSAHRIWTELVPYQNDPPSSGAEALTAVGEGRRAVATVREELQDIGSQIQACQREYEEAEQRTLSHLRFGTDSLKLVLPQLVDMHLGGFPESVQP